MIFSFRNKFDSTCLVIEILQNPFQIVNFLGELFILFRQEIIGEGPV